jgi:hypothetical protein
MRPGRGPARAKTGPRPGQDGAPPGPRRGGAPSWPARAHPRHLRGPSESLVPDADFTPVHYQAGPIDAVPDGVSAAAGSGGVRSLHPPQAHDLTPSRLEGGPIKRACCRVGRATVPVTPDRVLGPAGRPANGDRDAPPGESG